MAKEQPKGKVAASPVVDISADIERFAEIGVLGTLLADRSTGGNIIWASNVFSGKGESYAPEDEIFVADVTGENAGIIRARASKNRDDQVALTRAHAEVFTPFWIVKKMVDWADDAWYEQHEASPYLWRDYVRSPRLEITCGEAPYLVTRYDAADGTRIPVYRRCGVLDRKLMQIIEHVRSRSSWLRHATAALKSTYGYEYQGDNLLIARVNVLATMEDFCDTAGWDPLTSDEYKALAEVISWNLWQMNGLNDCVPDGALGAEGMSMSIPGVIESAMIGEQTEIRIMHERGAARIYNWEHAQELEFCALKQEVNLMDNKPRIKFDFVIGNPPYQDETLGDNTGFAPPIYNRFMDESYKVSKAVELIHPARFLFNAGSTPKAWNRQMLSDEHFKIISYWADSSAVFPNNDIKGGVVVSYHDETQYYGAIGVFTPFVELNTILKRVTQHNSFNSMSSIVITRTAYRLTDALHADYPEAKSQLSNGHAYDMSTNIFARLPQVFHDERPEDGYDYIRIFGKDGTARVYKYIRADYVNVVKNLYSYKICLPKANGSGQFGEVFSQPVILTPGVGNTETFLSVGIFDTDDVARNALKYISSKFARAMLGILKTTQDLTPQKWKYVPIQDFTSDSDIDWSQSIHGIDQQLYAKYALTQDEIDFIESHVKEMQ